jgi:hypothetical protein
MNLSGFFDGEPADAEPTYPSGDAIPTRWSRCSPRLQRLGPELAAIADQHNGWIARNPALRARTMVSATGERSPIPTSAPSASSCAERT